MLNYNSPIKKNKNYSDLTIKEIYPVMKLNIRGKKREFFTNVGKILNMILPTEANTSTTSDKLTSIWLSPDEWMIFTNDIIEKVGTEWIVDFNANSDDSTQLGLGLLDSSTFVDSTAGTVNGDSTFTRVQYVTNVTTGIQYKWTGSIWVKSYEGFYEPGTWSITF